MKVITIIFTILLSIGSDFHQKKIDDCFVLVQPDDFFLKMHQDNSIVLDVRLYKEFKKSRIDGAIAIPDKQTLVNFCQKLNKNTNLLIYCSDGYRSKTASEILCKELNFKNVYSLNQGLESWINRGYDLDETRYKK